VTASTDAGQGPPTESVLREGLPTLSREDILLVAIPVIFVVALLAHALVGVALEQAVGGGAVASAGVVLDAIYLNPPSSETAQ